MSKQHGKTPALKRPQQLKLSKQDLLLMDTAIDLMRSTGAKNLGQFKERIPELEEVVVQPGDAVQSTPVVEAVLAVTVAAVMVYKAYKTGALRATKMIPESVFARVNFKNDFTLEELVQAREQIGRMM